MLRSLRRPEYLFRPQQIWRRLRHPWSLQLPPTAEVTLPWGWPLRIRTHETIGRLVWTFGVFDLPVTETLWRLTDPGEVAADVGANIGCMTCVLAARTGATGQVLAFEPFPEVLEELRQNVAAWQARPPTIPIRVYPLALGARPGTGALEAPDAHHLNRGLARVDMDGPAHGAPAITIDTLDRVAGDTLRIGVLKIDVEGNELPVLLGARQMLQDRRIRDIVFEDHGEHPTPVTRHLLQLGYQVYSLRNRLRGLVVRPAGEPTLPLDELESQSFIATCDPRRLEQRLSSPGWQCLRGRA